MAVLAATGHPYTHQWVAIICVLSATWAGPISPPPALLGNQLRLRLHPRLTEDTSTPASTASTPSSAASGRLTTVQWEAYHEREQEGPGSYAFGYDVQDGATGNVQFREESRSPDGTVRGSYGLVEPDGNVRIVHYVADHMGFRVEIENTLKPDEQHPPPSRLFSMDVKRRRPSSSSSFLQGQAAAVTPYFSTLHQ